MGQIMAIKKIKNDFFSLNFHCRIYSIKKPVECKALQLDVSDTETQTAILAAFLGGLLGIGVPVFYASRDEADEKRLEGVRSLNRATKEATGEFMSEEEISAIRPPRWTDRREFVDDD